MMDLRHVLSKQLGWRHGALTLLIYAVASIAPLSAAPSITIITFDAQPEKGYGPGDSFADSDLVFTGVGAGMAVNGKMLTVVENPIPSGTTIEITAGGVTFSFLQFDLGAENNNVTTPFTLHITGHTNSGGKAVTAFTVPRQGGFFKTRLSLPPTFVNLQKISLTFAPLWTSIKRQDQYTIDNLHIAIDVVSNLRLFLDVDGGFDPSRPGATDDATWYVPCSSSPDGASVPLASLPQRIRVIAAYVDEAGAIVAPPSSSPASLNLSKVSAFKGVAMNARNPFGRHDDAPDFEAGDTIVAFNPDNHTARFEVACWDYGGFATAIVKHGAAASSPLRLPKDENVDWIPDPGWHVHGVPILSAGLVASSDSDVLPVVSVVPAGGRFGDGLTDYEEYRGFIVQGQHERTDPFVKDLFVSSDVPTGMGYAVNLPVALHHIYGQDDKAVGLTPEYHLTDRTINFNRENSNGSDIAGHDQRALRVVSRLRPDRLTDADPETKLGFTSTLSMDASPNETIDIEVYLRAHFNLQRIHGLDLFEVRRQIGRTVAHEIGHGVNLCHRPSKLDECADPARPGSEVTIMNTGGLYFAFHYGDADVAQIRLHLREK